jgi:FixJ family two-component response regulator
MLREIVHVVDDDESFREGISNLLRAAGYVVRTYNSVGEFLLAGFDETPGCILLDVRLPGPSGLDLQRALTAGSKPLPIIFLSGYPDIPAAVQAIRAGAVDFLTKPVDGELLLSVIRRALTDDAKSRGIREQLKEWCTRYENLSPRELQVFERVVAGKMNKVIASELGAAERTIKAHRAHVMAKMRATSLAELVHIADRLQAASASSSRKPPPALQNAAQE